jgi:DNA-directed RNA polymerase subunit RPC12/RpoP
MALYPCLDCGKEISEQAKTCPNCGRATSILISRMTMWRLIRALMALVLIVWLFAELSSQQ